MNIRPVIYVVGLLLTVLALLMLLPAIYHLTTSESGATPFLASAMVTATAGIALFLTTKPDHFNLKPREAFLLTNLSWLSLSTFAALPLYLELNISYTDAFLKPCPASPQPAPPSCLGWMI